MPHQEFQLDKLLHNGEEDTRAKRRRNSCVQVATCSDESSFFQASVVAQDGRFFQRLKVFEYMRQAEQCCGCPRRPPTFYCSNAVARRNDEVRKADASHCEKQRGGWEKRCSAKQLNDLDGGVDDE